MQKTKIEWTGYVFNPIKGLCPVGCWYCYARKMYLPGFYSSKPPFNNPELRYRFNIKDYVNCYTSNKLKLKPGTKVFVCSTVEIFHPEIKKEWRDAIFVIIEENPDITFQILTKMPENIDRPMPDNVWLGVSVTGENVNEDVYRIEDLRKAKSKVKFVSYEPMLEFIDTDLFLNWLIIGRLTGHGREYDPPRFFIEELIERAREQNTPIFLKNNLKEIWQGKLIQEFPDCGGIGGNFGNK